MTNPSDIRDPWWWPHADELNQYFDEAWAELVADEEWSRVLGWTVFCVECGEWIVTKPWGEAGWEVDWGIRMCEGCAE